MIGLSESVVNFDPARPIEVISRSRDFEQIIKTEVARKRFEIREKLQGTNIGECRPKYEWQ